MANNSGIEWTDATWNPIAGCTPISPGCQNCYAATMARRLEAMGQEKYAGTAERRGSVDVFTGKINFDDDALSIPLHWKKPRKIFANSMSDLFHDAVPFEFVDRAMAVMATCYWHTFQVLTKRADRMARYFAERTLGDVIASMRAELGALPAKEAGPEWLTQFVNSYHMDDYFAGTRQGTTRHFPNPQPAKLPQAWPLPNVWLGVSVEDQTRGEQRIRHLVKCPAAVRFLSCEPLLGPVSLTGLDNGGGETFNALTAEVTTHRGHTFRASDAEPVSWVIVGGESGHGARPMHPDWARSLRDQCQAASVPFFFKQWGEYGTESRNELTGREAFRYFNTHQQWVNKASSWLHRNDVCLDRSGRVLKNGGDFNRAHDENQFPVVILSRIGKSMAGRLLDGREWNELPEPRKVTA